ncbi:hypothetical protein ACIBEF_00685 [Micromonospora sp. NPDC050795]|uniref:hypothetical protein n=1 Tax=Micromonospora sp. NPDC050795 TaxID=3364282 RepID=UPI0037A224F6
MAAPQVYIVCKGETDEGHDPEMAFSNLDGAKGWCQRTYGFTPKATGVGAWMGTENGVDEVWIRRMKVWDR